MHLWIVIHYMQIRDCKEALNGPELWGSHEYEVGNNLLMYFRICGSLFANP
jgi:hypothetical protein